MPYLQEFGLGEYTTKNKLSGNACKHNSGVLLTFVISNTNRKAYWALITIQQFTLNTFAETHIDLLFRVS
jgi:hypothetical protein